MLLDDALFEDGLVGVGLFVADMDALVSHVADKIVCVGLPGEFVGVLAGAVLLEEVDVLKGGEKAGGFGDWHDLAATDAAFDGGPALSACFAAAFLPSAEIEPDPCGGEAKNPFDG